MRSLLVTNLTKTFPAQRTWLGVQKGEPFVAVKGISFEVEKGEILGLLGPNGAGKTTTIQMLLGTLSPTSGQIYFFGQNFFAHKESILRNVGFASTYSRFPGKLTVYENLDIYGRLYGLDSRERHRQIEKYLATFGMTRLRNREAGALSAGETTRMMLAKAFLHSPKLVLLDEPTAALDPDVCHDVRAFILSQQEEHNISFLFTSHNMAEVAEVCNRVLVLKNGEIVADDTPEALAATISTAHVEFLVHEHADTLISYASTNHLPYKVQGKWVTVSVDEGQIAQLLQELAHAGVTYSQIMINTPQLEDYFVQISRGRS